jgi:hypothetical protein
MIKKLSLVGAALAMGATALVPSAATAQRYDGYGQYQDQYQVQYQDRGRDGYRDDRGGGYRDDGRGYGRDDRRGYDGGRYAHSRYRCNNSGTTGTIIGAIAGGLLGHTIAGRGDGTLGAVLGAGGGALAGRAIDRSGNNGNCRR